MTSIPVFFSVNDAYAPFLATALVSIRQNASPRYDYKIHVLCDGLSPGNRKRIGALGSEHFSIEFIPNSFGAFSSLNIYTRLFIPSLFPQYDKGIYLDSDIIVPGDISELWEEPLGGKLIGACADYSVLGTAPLVRYIDEYVGVEHRNYVNPGVLLMDLKGLRRMDLCGKFLYWMQQFHPGTVAPGQDYLNALCKGRIHYLDPEWNAMPTQNVFCFEDPRIIHFNHDTKPWMNECVPYGDLFWMYAASSGYEDEIRRRRNTFLQDAEAKKQYRKGIRDLIGTAARLCHERVSFRSLMQSGNTARLCS